MPIYHALGRVPRKRHIVYRRPDGGLHSEELMGHDPEKRMEAGLLDDLAPGEPEVGEGDLAGFLEAAA